MGLGKDMEFLVKFWELEWTVSEIAFMGQLFHMMVNFAKDVKFILPWMGLTLRALWDIYGVILILDKK